jgi:hypothetical protein
MRKSLRSKNTIFETEVFGRAQKTNFSVTIGMYNIFSKVLNMKEFKEKLGIKEGKKVLVLNPPKGYDKVQGKASFEDADIIQIFIHSKKDLDDFIAKHLSSLKKDLSLWITYPKASPHLGINRDIIAKFLKKHDLKGVSICSLDETWSSMRFKRIFFDSDR